MTKVQFVLEANSKNIEAVALLKHEGLQRNVMEDYRRLPRAVVRC
jgi:hypothetical protein